MENIRKQLVKRVIEAVKKDRELPHVKKEELGYVLQVAREAAAKKYPTAKRCLDVSLATNLRHITPEKPKLEDVDDRKSTSIYTLYTAAYLLRYQECVIEAMARINIPAKKWNALPIHIRHLKVKNYRKINSTYFSGLENFAKEKIAKTLQKDEGKTYGFISIGEIMEAKKRHLQATEEVLAAVHAEYRAERARLYG